MIATWFRLIILLGVPMVLCSCSRKLAVGAGESRVLAMLQGLPIGSKPQELDRLLPESSPEKPEPGDKAGTEKMVTMVLFGQQMEGEFNYHKGKLVSHGFSARGLDRDAAMRIFRTVRNHLARRHGKPKERQGPNEDGHEGYGWQADWKLKATDFGVSCCRLYDGYLVRWGAQAVQRPVVPRPVDRSKR